MTQKICKKILWKHYRIKWLILNFPRICFCYGLCAGFALASTNAGRQNRRFFKSLGGKQLSVIVPQALQAWRHSLEQVLNSEASEATKEQVPPSPTQLAVFVSQRRPSPSFGNKIYTTTATASPLFLNDVARGWRPVTSSVSLPPSQKHWKATHFLEVIFFSWKRLKKWFYQVNFKVSQRKSELNTPFWRINCIDEEYETNDWNYAKTLRTNWIILSCHVANFIVTSFTLRIEFWKKSREIT